MAKQLSSTTPRALGCALIAVFAWQTVIELRSWSSGDPSSRTTYGVISGTILAVQLVAVLSLTSRRSAVAGSTLAAGFFSGVAVAAVWTGLALLGSSMPSSGIGAILLALLGCFGPAVWLARRHTDERQVIIATATAGLVAMTLSFSAALAMIHLQSSRIPDIMSRVMVPGSTAAQIQRENRIEIVDGYVALMILGGLIAAIVIAVTLQGRQTSAHTRTVTTSPA